MALTPADPTKWGLPAGAAEVTSQRGRDHKVFVTGPGQFVAKFRHYIHYQLGDGSWDDADLSFQPSGSDQVVTKNHLLHAAVRASGGLEVTTPAGVGVRWLTPQTPTTSGNRASYSDGTLSWTYEVGPRQVKHSATVAARRGPQSYQFTYLLLGGASDFTADGGGNLVSSSGFSVPRATILGADGSSYQAGPWQVLAGPRVAFSWDDTALPASAYPYVIDPTTTFSEAASTDDMDVGSSGSSYALLSSSSAAVGATAVYVRNAKTLITGTYIVNVSFYKFDTSSLTSGATISGATLDLTEYDTSIPINYSYANTDSRNLVGEYYAASNWPITTSAWTKTVGTTAFTAGLGSFTGTTGNAVSLTLSSPDANISKTSSTGFRLGVDGGQPTGKNNVCIAAFENTTSAYRPTLTVTYSTSTTVNKTVASSLAASRVTSKTVASTLAAQAITARTVGSTLAASQLHSFSVPSSLAVSSPAIALTVATSLATVAVTGKTVASSLAAQAVTRRTIASTLAVSQGHSATVATSLATAATVGRTIASSLAAQTTTARTIASSLAARALVGLAVPTSLSVSTSITAAWRQTWAITPWPTCAATTPLVSQTSLATPYPGASASAVLVSSHQAITPFPTD